MAMTTNTFAASFFAVALCLCSVNGGAMAAEDSLDVREVFAARLQRLQNVSIIYTLRRQAEPVNIDPALLEEINRELDIDLRTVDRTDTWTKRFHFCRGDLRYEHELSAEDVQQHRNRRVMVVFRLIAVYTGQRTETLQWRDGSNQPSGVVREPLPPPDEASVVDVGLGLRLLRSDQWLTPQQVEQASVNDLGEGRYALSLTDAEGRRHQWLIDAGLGYAPSEYEFADTKHRLIAVECTDFRLIGGIMVPMTVVLRRFNVDSDGCKGLRETYTAEISRFLVDDPDNSPERFRIVFPIGASVSDYRIQQRFQIVTKDTILDDDTIAELLKRSREESEELLKRAQRRIDEVVSQPSTRPLDTRP